MFMKVNATFAALGLMYIGLGKSISSAGLSKLNRIKSASILSICLNWNIIKINKFYDLIQFKYRGVGQWTVLKS